MKADARLGFGGWWGEEGLEFLPDGAEGVIVAEERAVHLGKPLENIGACGDLRTHLDEGADDRLHGERQADFATTRLHSGKLGF